ncbi:MAG: hypothetical protein U0805_13500 [Pirellulales bacterium]
MATIKRAAEERQKKIEKEQGWPPRKTGDNAARQRLKRQRAGGYFHESLRAAQVERIEAMNREKMQLADQHAADTAPLRARLKEIENAAIPEILKGGEAPAALLGEYLETRDRIHELDRQLADGIKAADERLAIMDCDRIAFAMAGEPTIQEVEGILLNMAGSENLKRLRFLDSLERQGRRGIATESAEEFRRKLIES